MTSMVVMTSMMLMMMMIVVMMMMMITTRKCFTNSNTCSHSEKSSTNSHSTTPWPFFNYHSWLAPWSFFYYNSWIAPSSLLHNDSLLRWRWLVNIHSLRVDRWEPLVHNNCGGRSSWILLLVRSIGVGRRIIWIIIWIWWRSTHFN